MLSSFLTEHSIFYSISFITIMSMLDRNRGTKSLFVWPMGMVIGLFFTDDYMGIAFITLGFVAGESLGWGEAIGAYFVDRPMNQKDINKKWQVGLLKTNTHAALIVRGLLWAIPSGIGGYLATGSTILIFVIFIPWFISLVLTKYFFMDSQDIIAVRIVRSRGLFKHLEFIRGALMGVIMVVYLL